MALLVSEAMDLEATTVLLDTEEVTEAMPPTTEAMAVSTRGMLMPSLRLMLELLPPTVDMPPPTDAMVLIVLATLLPPPTLLPVTAASMAGATCTRGRPMLRLMPDLPVPTFPVLPPATSTEAPRAPEDSTAVPSTVLATSTAAEACTRGPLM